MSLEWAIMNFGYPAVLVEIHDTIVSKKVLINICLPVV